MPDADREILPAALCLRPEHDSMGTYTVPMESCSGRIALSSPIVSPPPLPKAVFLYYISRLARIQAVSRRFPPALWMFLPTILDGIHRLAETGSGQIIHILQKSVDKTVLLWYT